jgi:hypothetical protein
MVDTPEQKSSITKETVESFKEVGHRALGAAKDILGSPTLPKPADQTSAENINRYHEISVLRTQEMLGANDTHPADNEKPPAA